MRGDEERRWSEAPRTSQKARAIHSAWVKWPGKAGTSFMSRRSAATKMPRAGRARERRLRSTRKNEAHVAGALEFWISLFGAFGRGLETSEEVRNDLQGKQDGDEGAGAEEGLKI